VHTYARLVDDDWRVTNHGEYLQGATFVRKPYRVWSAEWEHDHCEFCHAKFIDPAFSEAHAALASGDDTAQTEGYAALGTGPEGEDDYHWVCASCFGDFRDRFAWQVAPDST
jgi:hypothetical protein